MPEEKEFQIYDVQERTQNAYTADAAARMEQAAYSSGSTQQTGNKKRKKNNGFKAVVATGLICSLIGGGIGGVVGANIAASNLEAALISSEAAEEENDGWPSSLRAYPGGSARAVASYRTEISGTSVEEMMAWIEELKKDGFAFKDFYDFGMTESDMLSMNSWWATDGEIYLSVSYYDGLVTIDHTKELPDLGSYFE